MRLRRGRMETDKGTAFTTPGNGEVKDDINRRIPQRSFLQFTTKNNNTFYIVIDPQCHIPELSICFIPD